MLDIVSENSVIGSGESSACWQAENARIKIKILNIVDVLEIFMRATIPGTVWFIKFSDIQYNLRMANLGSIYGVIAAALTPLDHDASIADDELPNLLKFLAGRGCHGALLLGTTGEGPSFSPEERIRIVRAGLAIRQEHTDFKILVGTGTPSLEETISINRAVFDMGIDGVVVLPPYYYRKASESGLFDWFNQVIHRSVPSGATCLVYHIPPVSGISLSLDFFERLLSAFPDHDIGIKDSSADPQFACQLGERFGSDLRVFNGTDSLFDLALENSASGCITAMANLRSPDLRLVWEARLDGQVDQSSRTRLERGRALMERFSPNAPLYKALIHCLHRFPLWSVRPPLNDFSKDRVDMILSQVQTDAPEFYD